MTYSQALEYIHTALPAGSKPGLERTNALLSLMNNPEKSLRFIHLAGTNGKGSTASMTASVLTEAGYKAGLFTSPWIFSFNDYMRIDGNVISNDELADIVSRLKLLADTLTDKPTEFEFTVCVAMEYFSRHGCDIVCIEAGMGGELDATNVIPSPVAAVITNIGIDHTAFLGNTLEDIARVKSGIIKENTTAVIYGSTPEVEAVIKDRCKLVNAGYIKAEHDAVIPVNATLEYQSFSWKNISDIRLPLLGDHQLKNAATVLTLIEVLRKKGFDISNTAIKNGLERVKWQGRFEVVSHSPTFIIDGGHNPQCIEELVNNVKKYITAKPLVVLTGVLADKDYEAMYSEMSHLADTFVTVTPPNPRALTAEKLSEYIISLGARSTPCSSVEEGVRLAVEKAGKSGAVVAYGSLYMVGDIENAIRRI